MSARLATLAITLAATTACFPVRTPVGTSLYEGTDHDTVIVLLPGFGARDTAFSKKGIVTALRDSGIQADMIAVDATYGYYIKDQLITRLREDVWPRTQGYEHVWVMGISMGGLGTLLTGEAFEQDIEGLVLLSPYLGRGKTLDHLQAGPLRAYQAPAEPMWDEELWTHYKQIDGQPDALPVIFLGHGDKDLGVSNHDWLATYLPPDHVRVVPGGHTWKTWRALATYFGAEVLPAYEAFGATPPPFHPPVVGAIPAAPVVDASAVEAAHTDVPVPTPEP